MCRRLRKLRFETQIIERYRRKEAGMEEALLEMYLAGVSVRCVEDITEVLWGVKVCASTVSDLNQKIYDQVEDWRNKTLKREYTYVYLGWDVAEAQLERRSTQRHRAYRHWSESAWFS